MEKDPQVYDMQVHIARSLRLNTPELLASVQLLLEKGPRIPLEDYAAWSISTGMAVDTPQAEELADQIFTVDYGDYVLWDYFIVTPAFGVTAKIRAGEISADDALMLVDEHIPAPEHACLFKALILKDQAYIKLLEGHNKAAIKLSRKAISYAHGSTSEDSLRDCKYAEALCLYESDRFREAAPKLKALWKMFENAKHFPTPTNNHRLRQEVLSMLRVSHFRLNEIGAASQVQGTMYELGYCAETAEEYQRRFKEEPGAATALTALRRWLGEQNVDEN